MLSYQVCSLKNSRARSQNQFSTWWSCTGLCYLLSSHHTPHSPRSPPDGEEHGVKLRTESWLLSPVIREISNRESAQPSCEVIMIMMALPIDTRLVSLSLQLSNVLIKVSSSTVSIIKSDAKLLRSMLCTGMYKKFTCLDTKVNFEWPLNILCLVGKISWARLLFTIYFSKSIQSLSV